MKPPINPSDLWVPLMLMLVTGCSYKTPADSADRFDLSVDIRVLSDLKADTVRLEISNGSLSPDYQFDRSYTVTARETVYRERTGERTEAVHTLKMKPEWWEKVRTFNPNTRYDKSRPVTEGGDEAYLFFTAGNKTYHFPAWAMPEKADAITAYTETGNAP